jgi:hypothetical protein
MSADVERSMPSPGRDELVGVPGDAQLTGHESDRARRILDTTVFLHTVSGDELLS